MMVSKCPYARSMLYTLLASSQFIIPTLGAALPDYSVQNVTGFAVQSSSEEDRAAWPNPPKALPRNATPRDLKWQPSLDFDTDGCYNVPAIDKSGNVAEGLPCSTTEGFSGGASAHCREASDLDNNNVYSRQRCNRKWCAYMYSYYFEKDFATVMGGGHRHDWETVVVWTKSDDNKGTNERLEYVAVSRHGNYQIKPAKEVRMDGTHPKVIYEKHSFRTHLFRFARRGDDKIENHKGVWFRGALVSYNGFPAGVRDTLFKHDFKDAHLGMKDGDFQLPEAMPKAADLDGFDCAWDDPTTGSPGYPSKS